LEQSGGFPSGPSMVGFFVPFLFFFLSPLPACDNFAGIHSRIRKGLGLPSFFPWGSNFAGMLPLGSGGAFSLFLPPFPSGMSPFGCNFAGFFFSPLFFFFSCGDVCPTFPSLYFTRPPWTLSFFPPFSFFFFPPKKTTRGNSWISRFPLFPFSAVEARAAQLAPSGFVAPTPLSFPPLKKGGNDSFD